MQCPRCAVSLDTSTVAGTQIDVCPKCVGWWLDSGELEKLVAHRRRDSGSRGLRSGPKSTLEDVKLLPAESPDHPGGMDCPGCNHKLDPCHVESAGTIIIDHCPSCRGVWLDKRELKQIVERVRHEAGERDAASSALDSIHSIQKARQMAIMGIGGMFIR